MSDSKPHSAIHAENYVPDNTNGTKDKKKVRYYRRIFVQDNHDDPTNFVMNGEKDQYFRLNRWFECDMCS